MPLKTTSAAAKQKTPVKPQQPPPPPPLQLLQQTSPHLKSKSGAVHFKLFAPASLTPVSVDAPIEISSGYCHGYLRTVPYSALVHGPKPGTLDDETIQKTAPRFWFVFDDFNLRMFTSRNTAHEVLAEPIMLEHCTIQRVAENPCTIAISMSTEYAHTVFVDKYLFANTEDNLSAALTHPTTPKSPLSPLEQSDDVPIQSAQEMQPGSSASSALDNESSPSSPTAASSAAATASVASLSKLQSWHKVLVRSNKTPSIVRLLVHADSEEECEAWYVVLDRTQDIVHTTFKSPKAAAAAMPMSPMVNRQPPAFSTAQPAQYTIDVGDVDTSSGDNSSNLTPRSTEQPRTPRSLAQLRGSAVDQAIDRLYHSRSQEMRINASSSSLNEAYEALIAGPPTAPPMDMRTPEEELMERSRQLRRAILEADNENRHSLVIRDDLREMILRGNFFLSFFSFLIFLSKKKKKILRMTKKGPSRL